MRKGFEKVPKDDLERFARDTARLLIYVGLGAFLIGFAVASVAFAHDVIPTAAQPKGWIYPFYCCSGYDCREVPDTAIGEGKFGYTIKRTGELLPYRDTRLKDSPDNEYHWCSVAGSDDTRTICLFVPPRSY